MDISSTTHIKRLMPKSSVAIIIVNWNTYSYSRSCLEQLFKLSYEWYEVFLVDNGSDDGSGEMLRREFPNVNHVQNHQNLGFTGGNNAGISLALSSGFDYIFLLNNDTYFDKDFLNPLVKFLDHNPEVGAVQPLIYEKNEPKKVWHAGGTFGTFTGSTASIKEEVNLTTPYESEWLTGCAFMIRRSVIIDIGSLNLTFFAYFEDVDWSFRIKSYGKRLFIVPGSILYHEVSGSTKAKAKTREGVLSPLSHYLNCRNQLLLLKSHRKRINRLTAWPFQLLKFSMYFTYFILKFRFKKLNASFDGVKHGFCHDPNVEKLPNISCYL